MKYRLLMIALLALFLTGCGASNDKTSYGAGGGMGDSIIAESRASREELRQSIENAKQLLPEEAVARLEAEEGAGVTTSDFIPDSDTTYEDQVTESSDATNVEVSTSKEELQQMIRDNEDLTFYSKVPNDTTGRWRMGVYYSSSSPENFALDYYKAYFEDDSETHGLINLANKTSACLNVYGDKIDIMIYEYVDKEETDADMMFTGMFYGEYQVDKTTGEIEKIQ